MPFFAFKIPNTYSISIPVFGIGLNTGIPEFGIGIGIPNSDSVEKVRKKSGGVIG